VLLLLLASLFFVARMVTSPQKGDAALSFTHFDVSMLIKSSM